MPSPEKAKAHLKMLAETLESERNNVEELERRNRELTARAEALAKIAKEASRYYYYYYYTSQQQF